jgi:penicillin amidase
VTLAAAGALALAAPAVAAVRQAESVLPPGQSGFVSASGVASGTGSPHLTDQTELFTTFRFKNAMLGQPVGAVASPAPGVTIARDAYGMPTITGQTEGQMWFGAGYAVAEDRLFQLELFRRATQGRLAEILGKGYLEDDVEARRDFYTTAEVDQQFAALPPQFQQRVEAYRDGVNAYIREVRTNPTKLPGEFAALGVTLDDWTIRDTLTIGVFLARTVPSDDGEEMTNARALAGIGGPAFDRLLPIRLASQIPTIPATEGLFPSQPDRSRRQERKAFKRSQEFLRGIKLPADKQPTPGAKLRAAMAGIGRTGGSNMWAIRSPDGKSATLFNGPQLGFSIPELFVEMELHAPGVDVRGATAPGVPVLGLGHNEHVAWGLTSGLTDDDDLYVEQLTGDETYRFRGQERRMECRDEVFRFRSPPTDAGLEFVIVPGDTAGQETRRLCRTLHGPVQEREGDRAFARRYAIWGRELDTLAGLAEVNVAKSIADIDAAMDKVTWNENVMAADDQGNIGFWHPGLLQLKPRGFDERLPYPGTGEAEWRGFLTPDQRPQVVNPKQGYLFNWNNVPSFGWTQGDAPARERLSGKFHRAGWLGRLVKSAHRRGGGYERSGEVDRLAGTFAQQRPLATRELRRARKGARTEAAAVLDAILRWNGSYHVTDAQGTVEPGVAAWEEFKRAAQDVALGKLPTEARLLDGGKGTSHAFDVSNGDAYALRTLTPRGYRQAAKLAFLSLSKRFGTDDFTRWREPRRLYKPSAQGAGKFPTPFPFFDRGTFQHNTELGP